MKKIKVWKILVLNIITLGIYSLFWLINRRSEMAAKYRKEIPHWSWLVMPILAIPILLLITLGLAFAFSLDEFTTTSAVGGMAFLTLLAAAAIGIWWIWEFSKAAEYVNNGKFTADWSLVLAIIAGPPIMAMFQQYYFNRALSSKALAGKSPSEPSTRLKVVALTCVVVSLILGIAAILVPLDPSQFEQFGVPSDPKMEAIDKEVDRLTREYDKCVDKLDRTFPEVTATNEAAYDKAYKRCDTLWQKQNEAMDKYEEYVPEYYGY